MHISNEFLMHFSLALAVGNAVWDKLSTSRQPTEGQKLCVCLCVWVSVCVWRVLAIAICFCFSLPETRIF